MSARVVQMGRVRPTWFNWQSSLVVAALNVEDALAPEEVGAPLLQRRAMNKALAQPQLTFLPCQACLSHLQQFGQPLIQQLDVGGSLHDESHGCDGRVVLVSQVPQICGEGMVRSV